MTTNAKCHLLAIAFLLCSVVPRAYAVGFFLEDLGAPIAWPDSGNVITGTVGPGQDLFNIFRTDERAGQDPFTLTQTFQVDSDFDLSSVFIPYRNDITSLGQRLQIFPVSNVNSLTIPTSIPENDFLFNETFDALTTDNTEQVAQLVLDTPLTLLANTPNSTEGYALRFVGNDPGRFRWYRNSSVTGDIYPNGNSYERGNANVGGTRDFGLVLSDAPAPRELMDAFSVQSGSAAVGTTWSTGAPPELGFVYNVVDGHTVTVDSLTFDGSGLVVSSGATLDLNASSSGAGVDFGILDVRSGGTLDTSSITGTITLGDVNASRLMRLNVDEDITLSPTAGGNVLLFASITGTGDINIQSNGAGTLLGLIDSRDHEGVIRFNGTGDEVRVANENDGFNILEMNSTGDNELVYVAPEQTSSAAIIFNQPGKILHRSPNDRRQTTGRLEVNADVVIDLNQAPGGSPLRFRVNENLTGSGDLNISGRTVAPAPGGGPNEFEVGFSGEPSEPIINDFSGTLSASDFVRLEIYNSLPNARLVLGANASVVTGHRVVEASQRLAYGEVEVTSGGEFVVGFADGDNHNAHTLRITSAGSRDGDLTTSAGSTIVMQINGTGDGQFDRIIADGDVSLGGELELLINPLATDGDNPVYTPMLGDTFDLISIGRGPTDGDYTGDGVVDLSDYDVWLATLGSTGAGLAADGNVDGVVDLADYTFWRDNFGDEGLITGALSGSLTLNVVDPDGALALAGLTIQLNTTATSLQAVVVSASAVAVPEPSAAVVCLLGAILSPLARVRRY